MTPPRVPAAPATPAPDCSQESPEVQQARKAVEQAGYTRNGAEATYKAAVKDHGADSPEAKAAKTELDKAQAKVENAQADLRAVLKLPQGKKSAAPTKTASAPSPQKNSGNGSKPVVTGNSAPKDSRSEKVFLQELRRKWIPLLHGEYLESNRAVIERMELLPELNKEQLEKLLKEVKEGKIHGEYLQSAKIRHGDATSALQVLRKLARKAPVEKPHADKPRAEGPSK